MGALEDLRKNILALPRPTGAVTRYWASRCEALKEAARTQPLENFLSWTDDLQVPAYPVFDPWYYALRASPQWDSRWKKLSRKEPHGNPHPYPADPGTSPVSLQHVYHLMSYEDAAGGAEFLDGIDAIVEVGGGYGNFARMLRLDGFRGPHYIIDLPHTREFQRAYLRLCGLSVTDKPMSIDGVVLLLEEHIPTILKLVKYSRVAFVATWSLSETSLAFRQKLFPALDVAKALIASQWPTHVIDGEAAVNNELYFTDLVKARPHSIQPVYGMASRYVFIFDKETP